MILSISVSALILAGHYKDEQKLQAAFPLSFSTFPNVIVQCDVSLDPLRGEEPCFHLTFTLTLSPILIMSAFSPTLILG